MAPSKPTLLVAGSSFVKRLEKFQRVFWAKNLEVRGNFVQFLGLPGKGVEEVRRSVLKLSHERYRVVVLHVGNNDLCRINQTPSVVAKDLLSLAEQLLSVGTRQVVICQLLHRASTSHFDEGLTLTQYNDKVDDTNSLLENEIQNSANPGVRFWFHHYGVRGSSRLENDGIHLNDQGMKNFRRSIIAALSA